MKKTVLILLGCLFLSVSYAYAQNQKNDSIPQIFDNGLDVRSISKSQADSAYIASDYKRAAQIYEYLLSKGVSAEIYYNLGNSYYKDGNIAKAILNYERALQLQPGDGDIRANLDVARSKAIDKVDYVPDLFFVIWIKSLINTQSADSWAIFSIVCFILFLIVCSIFLFSKHIRLKKISFAFIFIFMAGVLCGNLSAHYLKSHLLEKNEAIILEPSVIVRSTPSNEGTTLFVLHAGRKVFIKDHSMKEWKEIRLEDGKVGWVQASSIEVI